MIDEQNLIEQVKHNCNISDANYWGYFSMCNLLLRLRDLYCHEHALNPWDSLNKDSVSAWIADRESLWETLEGMEFNRIRIGNSEYDPFAVDEINAMLSPLDLAYGAGFGLLKKPTFFLGRVRRTTHRMKVQGDVNVFIILNELSRDLAPPFAMSQGNTIIVRQQILAGYLFHKYLNLGSSGDFARMAFSMLGLDPGAPPQNLPQKIAELAEDVSQVLVWHEIGEIAERRQNGTAKNLDDNPWMDLIAASTDRLTEFRLRAIKDILADTSNEGPLNHIIERKDTALLYFLMGMMDETRKSLFPDLLHSAREYSGSSDWEVILQASHAARKKARTLTDEILAFWNRHHEIQPVQQFLAGLVPAPSTKEAAQG